MVQNESTAYKLPFTLDGKCRKGDTPAQASCLIILMARLTQSHGRLAHGDPDEALGVGLDVEVGVPCDPGTSCDPSHTMWSARELPRRSGR